MKKLFPLVTICMLFLSTSNSFAASHTTVTDYKNFALYLPASWNILNKKENSELNFILSVANPKAEGIKDGFSFAPKGFNSEKILWGNVRLIPAYGETKEKRQSEKLLQHIYDNFTPEVAAAKGGVIMDKTFRDDKLLIILAEGDGDTVMLHRSSFFVAKDNIVVLRFTGASDEIDGNKAAIESIEQSLIILTPPK